MKIHVAPLMHSPRRERAEEPYPLRTERTKQGHRLRQLRKATLCKRARGALPNAKPFFERVHSGGAQRRGGGVAATPPGEPDAL